MFVTKIKMKWYKKSVAYAFRISFSRVFISVFCAIFVPAAVFPIFQTVWIYLV